MSTEAKRLHKALPVLATLAQITALTGLATLATVAIPVTASESVGELLQFLAVTFLFGGPLFAVQAARSGVELLSVEVVLLETHLVAFLLALLLARGLDKSLRRWGALALLVPYLPPLLLAGLAWRRAPDVSRARTPIRQQAVPASSGSGQPATSPPPQTASPLPAPRSIQPAVPSPGLSTRDQQAQRMDLVQNWLRSRSDQVISVDVISTWPGAPENTVHRAEGRIVEIAEHPTSRGVYRLEFDSHLWETPGGDYVVLGHEVTAAYDQGSRVVVHKGPNQRIQFSVVAPMAPAAPPAAEPMPASLVQPQPGPLRCSVCHRTSSEIMDAFSRERPGIIILDTSWIGICPDCGMAFCVYHGPKVRDDWNDLVPGCPVHKKVLQLR